MAAAILVLARDPERRARMALAARETALALDWPAISRQTLRVYSAAVRVRAAALGVV
jgi:glycosyltransferase involved in cell wall biosynthesis